MKIKLLALGCAALSLSACGGPNGADADDATAAVDTIVLQCDGQTIDQNNRTPVSYLIKVHPGNQFQTSLHFYSDTDKRWISPCEERMGVCKISVDDNTIAELGELRSNTYGEVLMQKITEINRKTGTMRVQVASLLPTYSIFEGTCRKGEMPAEEENKF
jgi:hypothetical protein